MESPAKPRILAVEDDHDMRAMLEWMLRSAGYDVAGAENGRAALESARGRRPDLIVTDIMMPEMNGYDLCDGLRADPALSTIPVIFLTSLSDPRERDNAFAAGAVEYLTKPVPKKTLIETIRKRLPLP